MNHCQGWRHAPRFRTLALSLADQLSQQVVLYRYEHGKLPTAVGFWKDWSGYIDKPLHNSINVSDEVAPMRTDLDAKDVGWIYGEQTGTVNAGAVFNAAGAPTTRP